MPINVETPALSLCTSSLSSRFFYFGGWLEWGGLVVQQGALTSKSFWLRPVDARESKGPPAARAARANTSPLILFGCRPWRVTVAGAPLYGIIYLQCEVAVLRRNLRELCFQSRTLRSSGTFVIFDCQPQVLP